VEDETLTPGSVLEPLPTATGKDNLTGISLAFTWEYFLKQRTFYAANPNSLEVECHPKPNNDTKQPGGVEDTTTPADQDQEIPRTHCMKVRSRLRTLRKE
jgi:hypothetical protein